MSALSNNPAPGSGAPAGSSPAANPVIAQNSIGASNAPLSAEAKELTLLVLQLSNIEQRENALIELSKKRESFPDLAPVLWYSYGTITALLQEIVSIYPMLSPPTLTPQASNRVCNALALLQCVASHAETKTKLVKTQIPLYLYPFLNTVSRQRPFEYLRLTSLGVIGALVKVDDTEIVGFLLQTEIIPLCLRIMETGSELSKTVATFIVQKILLDDAGLTYICATGERFYAVSSVLATMVMKLIEAPSARLLKHIVRCYLRLSENMRARDALRQCLPESLKDNTFATTIVQEDSVQKWLVMLLKNLVEGSSGQALSGTPAIAGAPLSAGASGVALPPSAVPGVTAVGGTSLQQPQAAIAPPVIPGGLPPPPALTKQTSASNLGTGAVGLGGGGAAAGAMNFPAALAKGQSAWGNS